MANNTSTVNVNNSQPSQPQSNNIIQSIRKLDASYEAFDATEQHLLKTLSRIKTEEKVLRTALMYASETLQERRIRERKEKERELELRLEEALMAESDDEEEEEETF